MTKETTRTLLPFTADGKSLNATVLENGDLIIVGYAAVWEGVDREDENFVEGAFQRGIKAFLEGPATLAFNHRYDHGIGRVLELREDDRGLWMRARVDYQPDSSPLRYIYNAIKRGTYRALSAGGYFKRKLTPKGWRIAGVDLTEISVAPVPAHPQTHFSVAAVGAKALREAAAADLDVLAHEARLLSLEVEIEKTRWMLADLLVNGR
jgi:HK97 family phage prohead protease